MKQQVPSSLVLVGCCWWWSHTWKNTYKHILQSTRVFTIHVFIVFSAWYTWHLNRSTRARQTRLLILARFPREIVIWDLGTTFASRTHCIPAPLRRGTYQEQPHVPLSLWFMSQSTHITRWLIFHTFINIYKYFYYKLKWKFHSTNFFSKKNSYRRR